MSVKRRGMCACRFGFPTQSNYKECKSFQMSDGTTAEYRREMATWDRRTLEEEFGKLDYSQWERTNQKETKKLAQKSALPSILRKTDTAGSISSGSRIEQRTPVTVSSVRVRADEKSSIRSHPSTTCSSRSVSSLKKKLTAVSADLLKKQENINVLKFLIKSKRQAIAACEKQSTVLLNANMKLVQDIKDTEATAMERSRNLLVQYEKFGKAISKVENWGQHQVDAARAELQDIQVMVEKDLEVLEKQLAEISGKVHEAQEEAHTLRAYKDKEYPVKALRIAELQREVRKLKERQQDEQDDVEQLVQTEMKKQMDLLQSKEAEILERMADEKRRFIPAGLREMAFRNAVMKKEIEIHKRATEELEKRNAELQNEVLRLTESIKETRREIFSDILQEQPKCSPDMNVVLNIPREEWLPI